MSLERSLKDEKGMTERTDELLDEIVRLLVIDVRKSAETQADAIETLTNAGFSSGRISELLGTSAGTVRAAQGRLKKGKRSERS